MRQLFISDLHLGDHNPDLEQLFHAFMARLPQAGDCLYILGDFFEAWIGDDARSTLALRVIKTLRDFTNKGGTGYIMHGNRDFLIGQDFCHETRFSLLAEPFAIELNGQQCCLLHGDSLCTDDTDYQAFKTMVRDPQWQSDFLSKTLAERLDIARDLREKSQASMQQKSDDIVDANESAIEMLFKNSGADIIIHGHTHRQKIHHYNHDNTSKQRIVLGDWGKTGCVLIVADNESNNGFELRNFTLADL